MTQFLKQSTARTVVLGPFVDDADGVTAETGLSIAQADIRVSKNGGAYAQTNNSAGATHMENGYYSVPLDTTDTNTIGTLRVSCKKSGAAPVWRDFAVLSARAYARQVEGATFNATGGRVWYVDPSAGSSSNPGTLAAPLDTVANAVSAASDGDSIACLEGTYTAFGTIGKCLHVYGVDPQNCVVEFSAGTQLINVTAHRVIVEGFYIHNTHATGKGVRVASTAYNVRLIDLDMDTSGGACIDAPTTVGLHMRGIIPAGQRTIFNLSGAIAFRVEDCAIQAGDTVSADQVSIDCSEAAVGEIVNTSIVGSQSTTASDDTIGICVGTAASGQRPAVKIDNVLIDLLQSGASATGGLYGIAGNAARDVATVCTVRGGSIQVSHANGAATAKEIDAGVAGSDVLLIGTKSAPANWTVHASATVRRMENDVADTLADTADMQPKIGTPAVDLATDLAAKASQESVDALPSAADVTTDILGTTNGDDTVAEQLQNLDASVSSAATAATVSPFLVTKEHSWKFDKASQVMAPNLITEVSGFDDLLLEMDFTGALSNNASLSTIVSVTVTDETGKTEPTVVSSALSADRKKVHIKTDGASASTLSTGYTYNVTVTTTDSQTITRKGRLVVQ